MAALAGLPAHAQNAPATAEAQQLTPAQLFDVATEASERGDYALAEKAYRALAANPDIELRTEARFRLAQMLADKQKRWRDAAVELRRILDEKPGVASVRLELARMQANLGNVGAAAREIRAAQAAGLPPEVDRMVRFFAGALEAQKPAGANLEVALASDSNVNRATRSDTFGTIIGDFTLDRDAQATSGIGVALRGQAWTRTPLSGSADLLLRASADADIYTRSRFDDMSLTFQAGPQIRMGRDKLSIAALAGWRWYGWRPFTASLGATGNWQHPLGKRAQLRIDGSLVRDSNRITDLRDATRYSLAAATERSFTPRFGGGLQISGFREVAREPVYSLTGGGITPYLFREFGQTTALLQMSYTRLEADARAFLYLDRRKDDRFTATLSGTFRALRVGTFAPLARLRFESNRSTLDIYDFNRVAAEFGLTAAF
ncbi:surface lipoprotein assembly modifier [Sphingomonas sp.]|uniref:surface lipoprotein assembly modifier n=1 Tax=Sphingomonas sp. TaxID=28214 RepID=UPI002DD6B172|nr:surface lipoprotein assembly modifier [Sphingomonas sp.]